LGRRPNGTGNGTLTALRLGVMTDQPVVAGILGDRVGPAFFTRAAW
jgi:hypothetical protein